MTAKNLTGISLGVSRAIHPFSSSDSLKVGQCVAESASIQIDTFHDSFQTNMVSETKSADSSSYTTGCVTSALSDGKLEVTRFTFFSTKKVNLVSRPVRNTKRPSLRLLSLDKYLGAMGDGIDKGSDKLAARTELSKAVSVTAPSHCLVTVACGHTQSQSVSETGEERESSPSISQ